jgi:hypothetical protein
VAPWALSFIGYCLFIAPIVRGFVLKTLWAWFVIPVFGLPALGMASAYGLGLVVQTLVEHNSFPDSKKDEDMTPEAVKERIALAFARVLVEPLIILLFGWVAHSFM